MIIASLIFFFFLAFLAVESLVPTILQPGMNTNLAKAFSGQFLAYSHAALTFAENNQGYTGSITTTQLSPYMEDSTFPTGATAQISGGLLDVWATPPGLSYPQERWAVEAMDTTDGDYAYSVNNAGTLLTPDGGNMGAAPTGCPSGSAVYQIVTPHN